nr:GNAT family N-acetyltransferase [Marinomonas algarum]
MSEIDDVPALLDIFQQCEAEAAPATNSADHDKGICLLDVLDWQESSSARHPLLVVERQGEVIAWCALEPFYGLPAFDLALEISLYVMPAWQGCGVGQAVFRYIVAHRDEIVFTHLVAYVYASNVNSRTFFSRQGFEQWGRLPRIARHQGVQEDVLLLGRIF